MLGCGKMIEVAVPTRFTHKLVRTKCGSTGYYGYPEFCPKCEKKYEGRDWRREAEDAGEQWDSDY